MSAPVANAPIDSAPGASSGDCKLVCPLIAALRGATSARHRQIEARLAILRPPMDPGRYRRLLAALHGYHRPLDRALGRVDGWRAVGLDEGIGPRRKAPLLREDLIALGMSARDVARLPRCRALPAVRSIHAALGCLYVIEGATLGGRIIAPRVHAALGVGPGAGASFFHGYGAATDAMWSAFTAALAALPVDAEGERAVVAAAVETFVTLERWLDERGLLR
jgi:heme oxygenase (biliverdin-IX-beta and delta-forming)